MTSLKRHFLKNVSTDFSKSLLHDVKWMSDKLLKMSRRYLLLFLSYRENTEGEGVLFAPPPPPAARVNKARTTMKGNAESRDEKKHSPIPKFGSVWYDSERYLPFNVSVYNYICLVQGIYRTNT